MLEVVIVHTVLDGGNVVLAGLPAYLIHQLQSVLNAAAHLIYHLRSGDHITDALISLHWLWLPECIQYELAVLAYKVLHEGMPSYLDPLIHIADFPRRRALCSAGFNRLVVPPFKLSTVDSRAISS